MVASITQTFPPGPRLIDGSDLNNLAAQMNAALGVLGAYPVFTALTTVGAGTVTAAGIVGGFTARGGAQSGTAFIDTTATAAQLTSAAGTNLVDGGSFLWEYKNTTNAQATLAGGVGVTFTGNLVVPKLTSATYLVTRTSATAWTIVLAWTSSLVPLPATKLANDAGETSSFNVTGLTGAQLCVVSLTGTTPGVMHLPTQAAIITATPNAQVGMSWLLTIRNPSASTAQIQGQTTGQLATLQIQTLTAVQLNVNMTSLGSVAFTGMTTTQLAG